jgi:hypothetical protein
MWLRDSANQVLPYVPYIVQDSHLMNMIQGVINRQTRSVVYLLLPIIDTELSYFVDTILTLMPIIKETMEEVLCQIVLTSWDF